VKLESNRQIIPATASPGTDLFGLGQNLSLIKGMPQETVKNLPPFKMRFT
jgi:hypothetical protein